MSPNSRCGKKQNRKRRNLSKKILRDYLRKNKSKNNKCY